jgi:E-phenylitaconyl-CoA hydratase
MILTGNPVTAKEAEAMGLISKAVPADELESTAAFMATKIADNAPLAVAAAKKCLLASRTLSIEDGNALELELTSKLMDSKDLAEGITAVFAKRKPVFKGE